MVAIEIKLPVSVYVGSMIVYEPEIISFAEIVAETDIGGYKIRGCTELDE